MTEAEKEAARRWPLDGGDPETIFALRRAFVKGAEWQPSRAPQPTDDDRETLARIVNDEHEGVRTWAELKARAPSWRTNGDDYAIRTAYKTADALLAAGFRRAPAAPAVQGEWEYGYRLVGDDGNVYKRGFAYDDPRDASERGRARAIEENEVHEANGMPRLSFELIRRRKAGPWESVTPKEEQ